MLCLDQYFTALRNFFSFHTTCFYLPMKIFHTKEKKEVKKIQRHILFFLSEHLKKVENFFSPCPQYILQGDEVMFMLPQISSCSDLLVHKGGFISGTYFSSSGYLNWNLCQTELVFPEQKGI